MKITVNNISYAQKYKKDKMTFNGNVPMPRGNKLPNKIINNMFLDKNPIDTVEIFKKVTLLATTAAVPVLLLVLGTVSLPFLLPILGVTLASKYFGSNDSKNDEAQFMTTAPKQNEVNSNQVEQKEINKSEVQQTEATPQKVAQINATVLKAFQKTGLSQEQIQDIVDAINTSGTPLTNKELASVAAEMRDITEGPKREFKNLEKSSNANKKR